MLRIYAIRHFDGANGRCSADAVPVHNVGVVNLEFRRDGRYQRNVIADQLGIGDFEPDLAARTLAASLR